MNTTQPNDYLYSPRQAHSVLLLLWLLMVFDFIDRQVLAALLPAIKADWGLSDTQLGMLVSAVNVAIAMLALPTAVLVDRWSRSKSIGVMAVIWSLATGACALAGNFYQLLAARFVIGAGEAGYSSGGNALLSSLYPARLRGTVIGIFHSAGMVGSVLGVVLGGVIATHWGWRHAFGAVALPGLLLAMLMFFVRDYRTVAVQVRDQASGSMRNIRWHEILRTIFRSPVLLVIFVGEAAQLLFVATLSNWLPSFFNRVYGLPLSQAGLRAGLVILVSAVGLACGGFVVDRLTRGHSHRRLYGAATFSLMTALLFIAAFTQPPGPLQSAFMVGGALFMVAVLGPVMAALMDFVHPGMRSSAGGAMILTTNLFGMSLGPTVAGLLSDRFNLQTALLIMSFAPLISCLCYSAAGLGYRRAKESGAAWAGLATS